MQDLRYALRQFRKAPVFAAVAVLTLALGIGANTGIFTLLDQALLRTLPISHPEQLVRLRFSGLHTGSINYYGGDEYDYFSYPMYRELRDRNSVFSGMVANSEAQVGVQWNNQPELANSELVSGNYFDVLGVRPAVGRLLVPADDAVQNGNAVVVLGFSYWQERFNSDPGIIGKALLVNGHPFTIVGVAQPTFRSAISGYVPQVFFPMVTKHLVNPEADDLDDMSSAWLTIEARLKPGESRARAEAGINPLWRALRAEQIANADDAAQLIRRGFLRDSKLLLVDNARGFSPLRDQIRVPLLIVMGMVGVVLLMACINVSSLLLVRAAGRVREMSVRYSLGATRWQVARQLLTEGLLLGALGSVFGLMLAPLITSALARRLAGDSIGEVPFSSQPDHRVLLFNFGIALLAALLFSMAPALRFLHPDLIGPLKQQTATASGGPLRFRRLSVAVQIGLSLLLLIGAGLFVQTLRNLKNVDLGFATDHLLSFGIDPPLAGYKPGQVAALHQRILRILAALPGARSVGATSDPELMGMESRTRVTIPGTSATEPITVEGPWVTPGYFQTTGIPLLAGRDFTDQDGPGKPKVVMVNARFARRHFDSPQNAIGKMLQHGNRQETSYLEIIGVVGDSRHVDMRTDVQETLYRAAYQLPDPGFLQFYVRTWQSPDAAATTISAAMRQLDPNLVVDSLRTMDEQIAQSLSNDRLIAMLAVSFGALATLMAAVGLYGVLAYATAQRTREIGIRMALGARRRAVMRLVIADVAALAGISVLVTLPVAFLLCRLLRSQLYNVSPADPTVMASGVLLVALVVAVAALLPARRAASVEPMQALRTE
ncbi:MAG TPA: ABC transporter permease [Candidatus Binatia bacterium]|nr:ABC transporter permease [Candidatus Binatia bacterium]